MARPLKEKTALTRYFAFKTTEIAGREWDAKIAASGLTASEYIRKSVEKHTTAIKQVDKQHEQKILFLLAQQSNNINQIAHRLNTAQRAGTVSNHLYMNILEQLEIIATVAKNWRP